jgi:mannan endo-1,4-beta-mannosidase
MAPEFVKTGGTRFRLDGQVFPVRGVNCYFLGYCSDAPRRALLETASRMGATAVRSWAFLDGAHNGVAFQELSGGRIVQNPGPDGLERLDALIAAAEEFDLRLVLPFVNYWKDFGGIPRYLEWLGIAGGPDAFYRHPSARAAYKAWVEALLTRRNTRTGRLYAEEPAVMAWELANEPRCEIPGGRDLLLDWIGEMSAFVKSLDRNHLLAVGDEGYHDSHGVDGEAILDFGDIDFGTYHWYPAHMGHPPSFGETWIRDHIRAGERANKPMLLAEYGLETPAERKHWYSRWAESVAAAGGAGHLLWMLGSAAPEVAGFHDRFTIYRPHELSHQRQMV